MADGDGINIPGVKEPVPVWVLGVGGAAILFMIIMSRQGSGETPTSDPSGVLASELDQRYRDLWDQLYSLYTNTVTTPPVEPTPQTPTNPEEPFPNWSGEGPNPGIYPGTPAPELPPGGNIFPGSPPGSSTPPPPEFPIPGGNPEPEPGSTGDSGPGEPGTGSSGGENPIIEPPSPEEGPPGGGGSYLDTFRDGSAPYQYIPIIPGSRPMPRVVINPGDLHGDIMGKVMK